MESWLVRIERLTRFAHDYPLRYHDYFRLSEKIREESEKIREESGQKSP